MEATYRPLELKDTKEFVSPQVRVKNKLEDEWKYTRLLNVRSVDVAVVDYGDVDIEDFDNYEEFMEFLVIRAIPKFEKVNIYTDVDMYEWLICEVKEYDSQLN